MLNLKFITWMMISRVFVLLSHDGKVDRSINKKILNKKQFEDRIFNKNSIFQIFNYLKNQIKCAPHNLKHFQKVIQIPQSTSNYEY